MQFTNIWAGSDLIGMKLNYTTMSGTGPLKLAASNRITRILVLSHNDFLAKRENVAVMRSSQSVPVIKYARVIAVFFMWFGHLAPTSTRSLDDNLCFCSSLRAFSPLAESKEEKKRSYHCNSALSSVAAANAATTEWMNVLKAWISPAAGLKRVQRSIRLELIFLVFRPFAALLEPKQWPRAAHCRFAYELSQNLLRQSEHSLF